MSDINQQLNTINTSLNNIKSAIIGKGQTPSGDITTYAEAIGQISTGKSYNTAVIFKLPDNETSVTESYKYMNVFGGWRSNSLPVSMDLNKLQNATGEYCFSGLLKDTYSVEYINIPNVTFNSRGCLDSLCGATQQSGSYVKDIIFGECIITSNANNCCSSIFAYRAITGDVVLNIKEAMGTYCLQNMFRYCTFTNKEIIFTKLDNLGNAALQYSFRNSNIETIKFPALKSTSFSSTNNNYFNLMLGNCSNVTVHFPSNLESIMSDWSDVLDGFGGTNTTVLFDLPETE